jgi:anti-sigma regulatory factor (Ser/Thr protein kinase)
MRECNLEASAELAALPRLWRAVREFAVQSGAAPDTLDQLRLLIEELVANVVKYAYPADTPRDRRPLWMRVALDADAILTLQVEDAGEPFDPLAHATPNLVLAIEDRPIGGLGIHLIRRLADHLTYQRRNGRNVLIIRKALGPAMLDSRETAR